MLHPLLIALHACAGVVAAVAGLRALAAPQRPLRRDVLVLAAATVVMTTALLALVALDQAALPAPKRIAFVALAVLGLVLVIRAVGAVRGLREGVDGRARVLGHVGFVVIALLDAFCVVSAVDLRLPAVAVAVVAVVAVVPGVALLRRALRRSASQPSVGARG